MPISALDVKATNQEINPNAGKLRYLNANNKSNFIAIAFASTMLRNVIEPLKLEGENKRMANMCATLAHKLVMNIVDGLDTEAKLETIRAITVYDIEVVKHKRPEDTAVVEEEKHVTTMACHALEGSCIACEKQEADIEACELRKAMIHMEVPVFDESCPSDRCPYRVQV